MANNIYTIAEDCTLPSRGLVYNTPINPDIKLRAMTVAEEMKRLSATDTPYKTMCDIIEDCIVGDKPAISVYDMCLGDYQYLLVKLRTVTYGSAYKMTVKCPVCGGVSDVICELDKLEPITFDEDVDKLRKIHLPVCDKDVELIFQTPHILDDIAKRKREILKANPELLVDPGFQLTLEKMIKSVDGKVMNPANLETWIKKMNMRDANLLMQQAVKLNESVGLSTDFTAECKHCKAEILNTFRITGEFFGPSAD